MKYLGLTCTFIFSYGIYKLFWYKFSKENVEKKNNNKSLYKRFLYFYSSKIEGESDKESKKRNEENKRWINNIIFKLIIITFSIYFINEKINDYTNPPIELSLNKLNNEIINNLTKIDIMEEKYALLYTNNTKKHKYFIEILSGDVIENKLKNTSVYPNIDIYYRNKKKNILSDYISTGLNILYIYIIYYSVKNIGKIMSQEDNKKVIQLDTNVKVKLKDVAGMEDTKRDILEFVDFFKKRDKYLKAGARMPRGALFYGPPGTGKTLMAKAVAGECNIPFISVSGSDFSEIFVGVGSSRVRDLFKKAREKAPCIVFIDEIDALAKVRGNKYGGSDDKENTLNRLLIELDGFNDNENIMVFGATNRKDILDKALLRPGRFDRKIEFYLPEKKDRKEILNYYLKDLKIEGKLEEIINSISDKTYGFSPAEISNICNEASIISIRKNKEEINMEILNEAIEYTIIGPERRSRSLNEEEKNIVAHHESGHAFMSYCLKNTEIPIKVSIVPRGNSALGFSMSNISEKKLMKKNDLIDKMCVLIGGRVAEEIFFNDITNGAYDDIEKLTKIAKSYVKLFGMDKEMGYINYDYNLKSGMMIKDYSDNTNDKIDKSINELINEIKNRTFAIILEHKNEIEKISQELLKKETLESIDLKNILGNDLLNKY
jgi:AFG3 family protein